MTTFSWYAYLCEYYYEETFPCPSHLYAVSTLTLSFSMKSMKAVLSTSIGWPWRSYSANTKWKKLLLRRLLGGCFSKCARPTPRLYTYRHITPIFFIIQFSLFVIPENILHFGRGLLYIILLIKSDLHHANTRRTAERRYKSSVRLSSLCDTIRKKRLKWTKKLSELVSNLAHVARKKLKQTNASCRL